MREYEVKNIAFQIAAHPLVYGLPIAKAFGEFAPFRAILGHVQGRVEHLEVRESRVSVLFRQRRCELLKLGFGAFHVPEGCFKCLNPEGDYIGK